ncbi:MAG TPA: hypothetical protein ENJ84_03360, partial [Gammaproteobacteria bacterium]|nr:hypothetical protein [Gammaproteobacteria bacterium]
MMTRRSFLESATLLAANAACLPVQALETGGSGDSPEPPGLFADQATIRYIAAAYLKQTPDEADLHTLRRRSGLSNPVQQA